MSTTAPRRSSPLARALPRALILAVLAAAAPAAHAQEVFYDTLFIADELQNLGVGHAIGGLNGPLGQVTDVQIAEDFELPAPARITAVVGDYMTYNDTIPAEGVWVQFYAHDPDTDKPSEDLYIGVVVPLEDLGVQELASPLEFREYRLTMPIEGVELPPGRWWFSAQPLDINTNGDWFWSIGTNRLKPLGFPSHVRDGREDHQNEYRGLWNSTDWIPHNFRGNAVLSLRVEGERTDQCRADLTGDGLVDGADFLAFLAAFFSGDELADFDDNGLIDGADFLAFLQAFFAGC